jgi:hypothetical protein
LRCWGKHRCFLSLIRHMWLISKRGKTLLPSGGRECSTFAKSQTLQDAFLWLPPQRQLYKRLIVTFALFPIGPFVPLVRLPHNLFAPVRACVMAAARYMLEMGPFDFPGFFDVDDDKVVTVTFEVVNLSQTDHRRTRVYQSTPQGRPLRRRWRLFQKVTLVGFGN